MTVDERLGDQRLGLLVVAGGTTPAAAAGIEHVIGWLRRERAGTAVVHHDLREVADWSTFVA
jgi:hypothetical protein